jgi:UDP-glucose 4-epimerase
MGLTTAEMLAVIASLDAASGRRSAVTVFGTDYPTADGTAIRDYVHVCDRARRHVLAL